MASALLACGLGFLFLDAAAAAVAVRRAGYGIMAFTLILSGWTVVRLMKRGDEGRWLRGWDKESWRGMLGAEIRSWRATPWRRFARSPGCLILGGTLLCGLAEPTGYKVLFDEYVLQATAAQIHLTREIGTMVRAYDIEGVWLPLGLYIDKRPYFFAFILSGMHDVFGYKPANALVLNHLLTAGLLGLVYHLARRLTDRPECGVVAGWLLAGLPLLGQNTNGSGMEVLNAVMILVAMALGVRLVAEPSDARQDIFLLSVVLLAQCRYESAVFVVAAAGTLLVAWAYRGGVRLTAITIITPLLLLPVAWLHLVFGENQALWQLPAHLRSPFGVEHVAGNLEHASRYLFAIDTRYSNSILLTVAGGAGLIILSGAWVVARPRVRRREITVAALFGVVVLANIALLMHYYWGQLDDPLVARLALPLFVICALAAAGAASVIERGTGRPIVAWMLTGALVTIPVIYGRAMPQHIYTRENLMEQEIRWEMEWVAQRPSGSRMVVTNKSTLPWLLVKIPSLLTTQAALRAEAFKFHLEAGTFQEILVFQRWRPTTPDGLFARDPEDALPPGFKLEPLADRRFGFTRATINRLVRIEAEVEAGR